MKKSLILSGVAAIVVASAATGAFAAPLSQTASVSAEPIASINQLKKKTNPGHSGKTDRIVRPRRASNCRVVRINKHLIRKCHGPVYR